MSVFRQFQKIDRNAESARVSEAQEKAVAIRRRTDVDGTALAAQPAKRGRKPEGNPKLLFTLRLDREVIEAYRATGKGWQTRMSDILRENINIDPPTQSK